MKKGLLFFLVLLNGVAFAQKFRASLADLYLEQDFPLLSRKPVRDPNFNWDMSGPIQAQINDGLNNFDENHLELALKEFKSAVEMDPKLWLGHYLMGVTHETQKNYKAAIDDFMRASKLAPGNADIILAIGIVYYEANALLQASREFQRAIDLNPGLIQGYHNLGVVSLNRGEYGRANRFFTKCLEINPNFAESYNAMGYVAYLSRKYDAALELLAKALVCDAKFTPSYLLRGLVWQQKGNNEKWLEEWDNALKLNPISAFLHVYRSFPLMTLDRYDEAFTDIRRSIERVDINQYRGAQTALDRQIDLKFAARYLIKYGYGEPEQTFTALKKGFCLLMLHEPEKALPVIKEVSLEPSAVTYFLEALTFERLGIHDSAYLYYDLTAKMDQDNFDAFKKRGMYRAALHDFVGAYSDFEQIMRIDKDSYFAFRLRGMIKHYQGEYIGAVIDLSQYLQNDSADNEILMLRSKARSKLRDFVGSNEDLQKVAHRLRRNPEPLLDMSHNFLALRDTLNALRSISAYSGRMSATIRSTMGNTPLRKIGYYESELTLIRFNSFDEVTRVYITCKSWGKADKTIDSLQDLLWSPNPLNRKAYATLHHMRGLWHFGQHDYKKAAVEFVKSTETDPGNFEVQYVLAKSYEMGGQKKKAMDTFKQIAGYSDSEMNYQRLLKGAK